MIGEEYRVCNGEAGIVHHCAQIVMHEVVGVLH